MTQQVKRLFLLILAAAVITTLATAGAYGAGPAPVKIMVVAPVQAKTGQNAPDSLAGGRAAAAAINSRGGVNGHKIEVLFCNQGGDPNVAAACARQAADEHVAAMVGFNDIYSTQNIPIYESEKIPLIGTNASGNPIDVTSPDSYPLNLGALGTLMTAPFVLKKHGHKKIATVALDVVAALNYVKPIQGALKAAGLKDAGTIRLPLGVTDYAPYAEKIRSLDADAVIVVTTAGVLPGLFSAATALGVHVQWVANALTVTESVAQRLGSITNGMTLVSPFPPYRAANQYPAVKRWVTELKAAGVPQTPEMLGGFGLNTWLSVYAFAGVAKNIKGPITNVSVNAALHKKGTAVDLFGMFTWRPNAPGPKAFPRASLANYYECTIKDGQLVLVGKAPYNLWKLVHATIH
jgi:ABC-type branched-subunit amino acid transport system substrate-binding protein